jgi:periplasmic protein CpxP/Spy
MEPNPTLESPQSEPEHDRSSCPHNHRRRGFLAGLALGVLGAGLVGFAIGATMPAAEAAIGALAHRGFGGDHDGPPTAEEAKERAEFFVGFALHRLDATPDQQDRVQKIVDGAIDDLFPSVDKHRANREQLRSILAGPTIDRAAIEKIRGEEIALADAMSKTLAAAIADSAETLSVEQRTALAERLARFHRHH